MRTLHSHCGSNRSWLCSNSSNKNVHDKNSRKCLKWLNLSVLVKEQIYNTIAMLFSLFSWGLYIKTNQITVWSWSFFVFGRTVCNGSWQNRNRPFKNVSPTRTEWRSFIVPGIASISESVVTSSSSEYWLQQSTLSMNKQQTRAAAVHVRAPGFFSEHNVICTKSKCRFFINPLVSWWV